MRLLEGLSGIIFKRIAGRYLKTFAEKSPEKILRRSLEVIDPEIRDSLIFYIRECQHPSGGFTDRAGKPDIYYTLFGWYLAESLELKDLLPSIARYTENIVSEKKLTGVHLHCAAILYSNLGNERSVLRDLRRQVNNHLKSHDDRQPEYRAFITLLACYYLGDFKALFSIKKRLDKLKGQDYLPSPVVSALLVMQYTYGRNVERLKQILLSFTTSDGGFKATRSAPVADLLSTAVSLYALRFVNHDMRLLKPACLSFIDKLYIEKGFSANLIDPDPDIEYTFYGFLALGSLAD